MIPKIIHYCWFGKSELPELAKKCIKSWGIYFPDYQIKEWNESNYDVNKNAYIQQAYSNRKYAFVSDYARLDILYNYGGVYFDTDVEVLKSFDKILHHGPFLGLETPNSINAGLGMAAEKGMEVLKEILDTYNDEVFLKNNGTFNDYTIVERVTSVFKRECKNDSFDFMNIKGFTIYPTDFFCPKNVKTGETVITDNTYSIHHFDGSWLSDSMKQLFREKYWINTHIKNLPIRIIIEKLCVLKRIIKDLILK